MVEYSYKVGELKKLIAESSQEFKAKLGDNVERDNTKNNSESYKESKKRAEEFDGGIKEPEKIALGDKIDGNRTTLEYTPQIDPDESYKKKVEAQAKGYTSELEEKNGNERGGAEMDDEGRILKQFTDARNAREEISKNVKKSGLAAREFPDETFNVNHLVKEGMKAKRLKFKHTRFLNENQVLTRIPEEYKKDGQVIYMIDADDNEYMVECSLSSKSGVMETNIVSHKNKKVMNEQVNRMFELMGYSTPARMTPSEKINESSEMGRVLDLVRKAE